MRDERGWLVSGRSGHAGTSIEIVGSVLLDRPYRDAPVSPLMFQNKREDLAFEKLAGRSADRRDHVRSGKRSIAARRGGPCGSVPSPSIAALE